jgi:hypothetical protein
MDFKVKWYEAVDCIHLTHDMNFWWAHVNSVKYLLIT